MHYLVVGVLDATPYVVEKLINPSKREIKTSSMFYQRTDSK